MKHLYIIVSTLLITSSAFSQSKHYFNWAFGSGVHVNFNSGVPVVTCGLPINASEGCASYSDPKTGNFIAYTDGSTLWNGATNAVLANGTGLNSSSTSIETAMILPKPGGTVNQFYLFHNNTTTAHWSEIDMSIGTDGTVTSKNNVLQTNTTERCGTVPHANGCDYWVLFNDSVNAYIVAFLITPTGISPTPVVSATGISGGNRRGNIVFTEDYKKLGMNVETVGMYIFDFDNSTGIASSPTKIGTTTNGFGSAFSPDGTKVYYTNTWSANLYQYDLLTGTETLLGAGSSSYPVLGPDGLIYVSRYSQSWLGVVNNPNAAGTACNYVLNGLNLGACQSRWGLPKPFFLSKAFLPPDDPTQITICAGKDTLINAIKSGDTYLWSTGENTPSISINDAGSFWVQITRSGCIIKDSIDVNGVNCNAIITMPNVFSPNGDGTNDLFLPVDFEAVIEPHLTIYNRWGTIVHETSNPELGWNGETNGKQCSDGTYYWILHYNDYTSGAASEKGFLTLIR